MASDEIILEFKAEMASLRKELNKLKASLGQVDKKADDTTKEIKKIDKQSTLLSSSFKKLGGVVAAAFSLGVIKSFIQESVRLASIQQQSEAQLLQALKGRRNVQQSLIAQAQKLQSLTIFGDEDIIRAQSLIAAFVKEEEQIKALTEVTLDLAAAKGFDLASAGDLITKTFASSTNALSRYGIEVTGAAGSSERLESITTALNNAFQGQAQVLAETNAGRLQQLNNLIGDLKESFGAAVLEGIAPFVTNIKEGSLELNDFLSDTDRLVGILRSAAAGISAAATAYLTYNGVVAASTAATKAATIAQKGLNVAIKSNPVGLIAGLLATAAAAFVGYKLAVDDGEDSQDGLNESIKEFVRLINAVNDGNDLALFSINALQDAYDKLALKLETNKKLRENANDLLPQERQSLDLLIGKQQEQLDAISKEIELREEQNKNQKETSDGQVTLKERIDRTVQSIHQLNRGTAEQIELLFSLKEQQEEVRKEFEEQDKEAMELASKRQEQAKAQFLERQDLIRQQNEDAINAFASLAVSGAQLFEILGASGEKYAGFAKALATFQVALNQGVAIANAISQVKGLTGIDLIIQIAAITAQITALFGQIKSTIGGAQPPRFAKGGEVGGNLHSHGGTIIEAEKGEYVINRSAYAANKQAVEAINTNRFHEYIMKEAQKVAISKGQGVAYDDTALIYAVRRNGKVSLKNEDSLAKKIGREVSRQKYFDA